MHKRVLAPKVCESSLASHTDLINRSPTRNHKTEIRSRGPRSCWVQIATSAPLSRISWLGTLEDIYSQVQPCSPNSDRQVAGNELTTKPRRAPSIFLVCASSISAPPKKYILYCYLSPLNKAFSTAKPNARARSCGVFICRRSRGLFEKTQDQDESSTPTSELQQS